MSKFFYFGIRPSDGNRDRCSFLSGFTLPLWLLSAAGFKNGSMSELKARRAKSSLQALSAAMVQDEFEKIFAFARLTWRPVQARHCLRLGIDSSIMASLIHMGEVGIASLLGRLVATIRKSMDATQRTELIHKAHVRLAPVTATYVAHRLLKSVHRILVEPAFAFLG
jgi:hypothetical protein